MINMIDHHIFHQFDEELSLLHNQVYEMGQLALSQLCLSLESLREKNPELASETIRRESEVNKFEVAIDTAIFQILAKRCPVAGDLRAVVSATRIANNLERIGDEAAKFANYVLYLYGKQDSGSGEYPLDDVFKLGKMSVEIVREVIAAFETLDLAKAREIDGYQDGLTREFVDSLHGLMAPSQREGHSVGDSVVVNLMLKTLEKIGNHARDIAEGIIFQVSGQDVRINS